MYVCMYVCMCADDDAVQGDIRALRPGADPLSAAL